MRKVLLMLLAVGCAHRRDGRGEPLAKADRDRLDALAGQVLQTARDADGRRVAALLAAADGGVERNTGPGKCPIAVPVVGTDAMLGSEPAGLPPDWRSIRADQMMVVDPSEVGHAAGKRLTNLQQMVAFTVEEARKGDEARVEATLRAYADPSYEPWELVIVADQRVDPVLGAGGRFEAGAIVGRAYLYSHTDGKVVCAATVDAESSDMLPNEGGAGINQAQLAQDLEFNAFRIAALQLAPVVAAK